MKNDKKSLIEYDLNLYQTHYKKLKNDLGSASLESDEYLTKDKIKRWLEEGVFIRRLKFSKEDRSFYITTASIMRGNKSTPDYEFYNNYILTYWSDPIKRAQKLMTWDIGQESPVNGTLELIGEFKPVYNNLVDVRYETIAGKQYIKNAINFLNGTEEDTEEQRINIDNFFRLKFELAAQGMQARVLYDEQNCIIDGAAGTGKSTIAIQKLKYLTENYNSINQNRLLIIVRNKYLKKHFATLLEDPIINLKDIRIQTIGEVFDSSGIDDIERHISDAVVIKNSLYRRIDRRDISALQEHYTELFNFLGVNFFYKEISKLIEDLDNEKNKIEIQRLDKEAGELRESLNEFVASNRDFVNELQKNANDLETKLNTENIQEDEKKQIENELVTIGQILDMYSKEVGDYKSKIKTLEDKINKLEGSQYRKVLENLNSSSVFSLSILEDLIDSLQNRVELPKIEVLLWILQYRNFLQNKEKFELDRNKFENLLKTEIPTQEKEMLKSKIADLKNRLEKTFEFSHSSYINAYFTEMRNVYFSQSFLDDSGLIQDNHDIFYNLLEAIPKQYNTIVIDEAQDFSKQELEFIRIHAERVILTGDFLQNIEIGKGLGEWKDILNPEYLKNENGELNIHSLKHNFRQTYQLANASYNYRKLLLGEDTEDIGSDYFENEKVFNGKEFQKPTVLFFEKVSDEMGNYVDKKKKHIINTYTETFPIIAVYKNDKEKEYYKTLFSNYTIVTRIDRNADLILLHINEIKGEEFPIVFANVNSFTHNELYLIMTRAQFELDLFSTKKEIDNSYLQNLVEKKWIDADSIKFITYKNKQTNTNENYEVKQLDENEPTSESDNAHRKEVISQDENSLCPNSISIDENINIDDFINIFEPEHKEFENKIANIGIQMKPCEFIEKLATENKSMADALDNKRFAGMKRILADFYPDNAHFIYELLQNAEDTCATKISFELKKDRLIYQHNGKRTFTERDIESITSIGDSSKADDINSIGKFGVGFKAVFSYTNSPQIYSGDYSFEINNLVLPRCIEDLSRESTDTIFIFPFNNSKKPKIQAFEEIQLGLAKLHENTLLFLKNISEISVLTEKQSYTIKRNEIDTIQVEIHNSRKNSLSRWLRFKKPLADFPNLYVSVAYAINENEKTQKDEIIPINGEVSIFFPAEKETSNLKFHIHAPFASTVARDSFKHDNDDNKKLIELIAETVTESFDYIKKNHLLTLLFLGVLPNSKDNIANFYQPILKQSIQIFQEQEFMLTESGSFQPSSLCYQGSANLKRLFNDDDLRILTGYTNIYWSKNALQNSRADDFISSLEIDKFDEKDFYNKLSGIYEILGWGGEANSSNESEQMNTLFSNKSDEWYLKFYLFLKEYGDKYHFDKNALKFLIRLSDGQLNIDYRDCFFDSGLQSGDFLYVKKETYTTASKQEDNLKAKGFLELLGVKEVGEKEKISSLLTRYDDDSFPEFDEHLKHLELFIGYWKKGVDLDIFDDKYFLKCMGENDKKEYWGRAEDIYIDEPFEETGLSTIADYTLSAKYFDVLKTLGGEDFLNFCIQIGSKDRLDIVKTNVHGNPNRKKLNLWSGNETTYCINEDWTIKGLEKLTQSKSKKISQLIWNALREAKATQLKARYRPNKSTEFTYIESMLVHTLRENEWIPDENNNFYKPSDIDQKQLPKEFVYDNRNEWLTAIGFGENIRKNQQEYREKEKIAKEITGGHALEDIEALKEIPPKDLKAFLAQQKNKNISENSIEKKPLDIIGAIRKHSKNINHADVELDPAIIKNNEVYLDTLRKQHNHTIQKSTIAKSRKYSTKIKYGRDETVIFLKNQYKGHCQICGFTFTKTDGKNYFELLDWSAEKITKIKSDVILPSSSLCVCSNCHSMIKFGSFNPEFIGNLGKVDLSKFTFDDFCTATKTKVDSDNIPECYQFIEMDMYKLPIRLIEEKKYIFYTEEHFLHFFDLACLAKKGEQ